MEVSQILGIAARYMDKRKDFYKNSGLYVVGSSLKRPVHGIDIVVVGLDFRQIFDYTEGFLDYRSILKRLGYPDGREHLEEEDCNPSHLRIFEIESSGAIIRLAKAIEEQAAYGFDHVFSDIHTNPFRGGPYVDGALQRWFVSRIELERGHKSQERFAAGRKIQRPTIDLMFHAENLLVSAWKNLQKEEAFHT